MKDTPYREWRMEFVHWMWTMRNSAVAEGLLSNKFMEGLKDGAHGVHEAAVQVDPRVMGDHGRPRYGYGQQDPGQLSGVVWYVEAILDIEFDYKRKTHEDGRSARKAYYRVKRNNRSTAEFMSEQDQAYNLAQVLGDFWLSDSARTDQLFEALGLNPDQQQSVLMQVRGDSSKYWEIRQVIKDIYPFDKALTYTNYVEGAGGGPNFPGPAPYQTHLAMPAPTESATQAPSSMSPQSTVPSEAGAWSTAPSAVPEPHWTYFGQQSEGQWADSGAWLQEVPVFYQDGTAARTGKKAQGSSPAR